MASTDELRWAAGFFDGDGCVHIARDGTLSVSAVQICAYKANLDEMNRLFGGRVIKLGAPKIRTQNQKYKWGLNGCKAALFCRTVAPHSYLKEKQLLVGAAYTAPGTSRSVKLIDGTNGRVIEAASLAEMARRLEITRESVKRLKPPYTVVIGKRADHYEHNRGLRDNMMRMKKEEHATIEGRLSPAYCAGFLDADGCLQVRRSKLVLGATQKYAAITNALKSMFGGSVHHQADWSKCWYWTLQGEPAATCLAALNPFFVGKKPQAGILGTLTTQNAEQVSSEVKALKMRIQA